MYNLFVSENGEAYHGGPWQNEQSRCVREYTSDAIQERFGSFDDDADFDAVPNCNQIYKMIELQVVVLIAPS